MKIVIYSEYFFPISGGVQTNIFELACGLIARPENHDTNPIDVTLVTRTRETTSSDASWPFHLVRRPGFRGLVRLLRSADVVHIAGPAILPMAIGFALGKPVVVAHHGYQAMCPNGILLQGGDRMVCPGHFMAGHYRKCLRCNSGDMGWLGSLRTLVLQFPRRWLCKRASANLAVTGHVARRVALPRTEIILHGIRDCGRSPLEQNGRGIEIGYVGRLVHEKGLPVLLKAAKRLHDDGLVFRLTIVGDGPLRGQLERDSRELGLAPLIKFTGELAGLELESAVRPLQVLVMPSLWEETAGLAAIEQMMRGGVVVASDIGGLAEVVGDAGLKFTPGDSDSLYIRLRELLERPSVAALLSSAARERAAKNFNVERMVELHVALYQRLSSADADRRRARGRHVRNREAISSRHRDRIA